MSSPSRLIRYFAAHVRSLPSAYLSMETSCLTLAYFTLAGLDLLSSLPCADQHDQPQPLTQDEHEEDVEGEEEGVEEREEEKRDFRCSERQRLIDWFYRHQLLPDEEEDAEQQQTGRCGFRGSLSLTWSSLDERETGRGHRSRHCFDEAHLTQTYCALASLLILGDDLSRVDTKSIVSAMKHELSMPDGSFRATSSGNEADMRFVYSALAVSALVDDWSGVDRARTLQYVLSCQRYDGGFALTPDGEGHGGSTYLAVASLSLLNELESFAGRETLLKWCVLSQGQGFRGRPNKPSDSCYTFWIGATLHMLNSDHLTAPVNNAAFLFKCEDDRHGGFAKEPDCHSDLLHSYMGLAGLAIISQISRTHTHSHQPTSKNIKNGYDHATASDTEHMEDLLLDCLQHELDWSSWKLPCIDVRVGIQQATVHIFPL